MIVNFSSFFSFGGILLLENIPTGSSHLNRLRRLLRNTLLTAGSSSLCTRELGRVDVDVAVSINGQGVVGDAESNEGYVAG